jgi:hypothetical protein
VYLYEVTLDFIDPGLLVRIGALLSFNGDRPR